MVYDVQQDTSDELGTCNKCNTLLVPLFKMYCRNCFINQTRHKFRAVLGSSKVLPRDANVLIIFDGRAESVVLLDMVIFATAQNIFKRLHCNVKLLYIDDEYLEKPDQSESERMKNLKKIKDFLLPFQPLESFIVPLWDDNIRNITEFDSYVKSENKEKAKLFQAKVNAIKTLTSRQDYIKLHRNRLLGNIANQLHCKFVFMGDTSATLAVNLLSAVALGRGSSAALDVALVDDRLSEDVRIVRPLKDINLYEIELYLRARNLVVLKNKEEYGISYGKTASLQNMTRDFVDSLQKNYTSTVSTVFRTGCKIAVNNGTKHHKTDEEFLENRETCSSCRSPVDINNSTTLEAIKVSRILSKLRCDSSADSEQSLSNLIEKNFTINENRASYGLPLCRGCINIYDDCKSIKDYLIE